jgi:methanogenic corrinoid protein MtbC1
MVGKVERGGKNNISLVAPTDQSFLPAQSYEELSLIADEFLRASLELNSEQLVKFTRGLFKKGLDIEVFYLDIICLAIKQLHDLWDQDQISFFDVTRSTWSVKHLLFSLSPEFTKHQASHMMTSVNRFQALICTAPGAQHTLGPLIVSQYLQRKGWHVFDGFNHQETDLLQYVSQNWVDMFCVSIALSSDVPKLKTWIAKVKAQSKNAEVQCFVGGSLLSTTPDLADQLGAHQGCKSPRDLHTLGLKLVREHSQHKKLHLSGVPK